MSLLNLYCPLLIFLQEIWLPAHDEASLNKDFPHHSFKISTPDMFTANEDIMMTSGHNWHGVAIGWHHSLNSYVTALQSNCERFSGIKLCTGKTSIIAVSLYAPTHGKDDEFLECLSLLTEFLLTNSSTDDSIMIGADTNCSLKSSSRRRKAWLAFCENFSLTPQSSQVPTFHHHNGSSESCIDTILLSKHLKPTHLAQLCTLEDPLHLSSHDVLSTSVSVQCPKNPESKHDHTYSKFNRECIIWDTNKLPEYQALSSKALLDALEFWDRPEYIPLLCSMFSNLLVKSAKLVFETKKPQKTMKKCASQRIKSAEDVLKRAHKSWKTS